MAEIDLGFEEKTKIVIGEGMERVRGYESMSISEKLGVMGDLRDKKEKLKKKVSEIDVDLFVLGKMPDVARYQVGQSDSAGALLDKLRETGDISYNSFMKDFGSGEESAVIYCLHLLQDAKYIKIDVFKRGERIKVLAEPRD